MLQDLFALRGAAAIVSNVDSSLSMTAAVMGDVPLHITHVTDHGVPAATLALQNNVSCVSAGAGAEHVERFVQMIGGGAGSCYFD